MAASLHDNRYKAVVRALVAAREAAGMTQRDLAYKLKRPPSYVAKTEGLDRRLDVIELVDWANAVGAKPAAFIFKIVSDLPRKS